MEDLMEYVGGLQETLRLLPMDKIERVISLLEQAGARGRRIFIMGNGGSASTASHFVCDLAKNTRQPGRPLYRVIGLADNMAILSAYANDEGYENVFAQQLANLIEADDVAIAISASGNSPNVVRAMELAREHGATTIGFTGFDGGTLGKIVDVQVHVPSNRIEHVEDIHLMLEHMVTARLRNAPPAELRMLPASPVEAPVESRQEHVPVGLPDFRGISAAAVVREESVISERPPGSALLGRMLVFTMESLGADSGSTIVVGEDGEVVDAALAYGGHVQVAAAEGLAETLKRGLAGWVMQNRSPVVVPNTLQDTRWLRRDWDGTDLRGRSAICVPMLDKGRVMGVLTLVHPEPNRFTEEDSAILMALVSGLSVLAGRVQRVSGWG